jgi:hypothetical protein
MTERAYRIILGAVLLGLLFLKWELAIHVYIGLLIFEGITNVRIPILVSRLRFGSHYSPDSLLSPGCSKIPFDAERALRLIVASFLILSYVLFNQALWFFPWFVGAMLLNAGITNICPMVMGLRWSGFR